MESSGATYCNPIHHFGSRRGDIRPAGILEVQSRPFPHDPFEPYNRDARPMNFLQHPPRIHRPQPTPIKDCGNIRTAKELMAFWRGERQSDEFAKEMPSERKAQDPVHPYFNMRPAPMLHPARPVPSSFNSSRRSAFYSMPPWFLESKTPNFPCFCGKTFSSELDLHRHRHMNMHCYRRSLTPSSSWRQRFSKTNGTWCPDCCRNFASNAHLRWHNDWQHDHDFFIELRKLRENYKLLII